MSIADEIISFPNVGFRLPDRSDISLICTPVFIPCSESKSHREMSEMTHEFMICVLTSLLDLRLDPVHPVGPFYSEQSFQVKLQVNFRVCSSM